MNRDEVRDILENALDFEWQTQGFGMIRTYLPGEGEPRLQVWDQRIAVPSNNTIHDHPWAFTSQIIAGMIYNQRYGLAPNPVSGDNGYMTQITPGVKGGFLSEQEVIPCRIKPWPVEVYSMGGTYSQTHRELHMTKYLQFTVTLITRTEREEADKATIAWYGKPEDQPVFVNPAAAERNLVERITEEALATWWL